MSDFHISLDPRATYTQAQIDKLADIIRQCRSDEDIRRDNEAATREYQNERQYGWSVR